MIKVVSIFSMPYMCQFASCFYSIKFEFNSNEFEFKHKSEFNSM